MNETVNTRLLVLDTNILLEDPCCIDKLGKNHIVVPLAVLEELDNIKTRKDDIAKNARRVIRKIEELINNVDCTKSIPLALGGTFRVVPTPSWSAKSSKIMADLDRTIVDNQILLTAWFLLSETTVENFSVLSRDINLRAKCAVFGVPSEGYETNQVLSLSEEMFTGLTRIKVNPEILDDLFAGEKEVYLRENHGLFPNQFVILGDIGDSQALRSKVVRFVGHNKPLRPLGVHKDAFGIKAKSSEQQMALDLLMDDSIDLVTLLGPAGTGKTLLAVAAGVHKTLNGEKGRYEKLIVTRPIQSVGKEMGYLPGTLQEKMEPWIAPIKDNLKVLFSSQKLKKRKGAENDVEFNSDPYLATLIERGRIEIEAISFIRGRSIPNAFMIIDEAQNLSVHEMKTILTRAGAGTKIVLTGDIEQIDSIFVDAFSNGLTYAIEKFKQYELAAHMSLTKGERSPLATLASQIL